MLRTALRYKDLLYDKAVSRTLALYETWVLPCPISHGFQNSKIITLREAKLIEFRERKKLLNPYERPLLIDGASQEEKIRLEDLAKRTNFESMYTNKLSYDRHKNAYTHRVKDFPESYDIDESFLNWGKDPDKIKKFRAKRLNLKAWIIGSFLLY